MLGGIRNTVGKKERPNAYEKSLGGSKKEACVLYGLKNTFYISVGWWMIFVPGCELIKSFC